MIFFEVLFLILFFAVLFYLTYNRNKIKGMIGEKKVSSMLLFLDKEVYHTYNNLYLQTSRGTSQIDHIIVSQYGIFIIETKNYKGTISGSFKSDKWTQNIWGNKYSMPNPIRQNKTHIYALKSILPSYAWFDLISIIAFSSKASLYITTDENTEIVYIREILSVIKSYNNIKFSSEQVKEICDAIYWANVTDKDIRNNHKYAVQQKIYNRNTLVDAGICPNCGAELVERQGRYGSFTGCSRYPKCKFTTK
ncbi:MAG: NERD domain-containing protein [Bacteroidales bacterium]|nr:NERD domain-containing protein [Bacteroidales bacterium]